MLTSAAIVRLAVFDVGGSGFGWFAVGCGSDMRLWESRVRRIRCLRTGLLKMPWSIKTATAIIPPAFTTAVNAELASTRFDSEMYSSEFQQRKVLEEHRRWAKLSPTEKVVESLSNNKYKIITGLWAASMVGSWMYVNRDPLLTRTQKFVQARMYAQFITVALLLGSIGLSVYEENHHLNHKERGEDAYLREVLEANRQK
ncbi:hypothetical protein KL921_004101 [Ogataea angusta]|uniref:HIG1 domain-containing protein n=1 Tax=Pichia angusta TaxID=870730 RepID=A0ABQ7RV05_PICAN|nr:hypothetical protein KL921_004101 [Ogataea angusta]KAG7823189.1 hypothetical protein KL909_003212 [Ogataea angusta]KAG7838159.1 hypothetical protein KL943_000235 [Ogataea angusta]KAG7839014.1 hypothetical protein KL942_004010 [Ogataea angusta]KAG7848380.1 hypothetical protein KL940_003235 [Ogataea angusta]